MAWVSLHPGPGERGVLQYLLCSSSINWGASENQASLPLLLLRPSCQGGRHSCIFSGPLFPFPLDIPTGTWPLRTLGLSDQTSWLVASLPLTSPERQGAGSSASHRLHAGRAQLTIWRSSFLHYTATKRLCAMCKVSVCTSPLMGSSSLS